MKTDSIPCSVLANRGSGSYPPSCLLLASHSLLAVAVEVAVIVVPSRAAALVVVLH